MKELLRGQNPAHLALVQSLLQSADIPFFVFDDRAAMMGMLVEPWRIMVMEDDYEDAMRLVEEGDIVS